MSTYDEHDIKKILNRAAKLQQRVSDSGLPLGHHTKLTLEEIEEIAREAGVSADFVRAAALEYEGIPVEEPLFLDTGTNQELKLIGYARGTLNKKTWAELRSIIEYHFDCPGKATRRPDGIHWKAQPKGILKFLNSRKSPEIRLKTDQNQTRITVSKSTKTINKLYLPAFASYLAGLSFLVLMVTGQMGREAPIGVIMAAILGGIGELFRRWVRRKKEKERNSLEDLMQQLQTIVTRRFKTSSLTTESPETLTVEPKQKNDEKAAEQENRRRSEH
jgi:hypothetical protein